MSKYSKVFEVTILSVCASHHEGNTLVFLHLPQVASTIEGHRKYYPRATPKTLVRLTIDCSLKVLPSLYTHTHTHMYNHVHTHMHKHTSVYMHTHTYVCPHAFTVNLAKEL